MDTQFAQSAVPPGVAGYGQQFAPQGYGQQFAPQGYGQQLTPQGLFGSLLGGPLGGLFGGGVGGLFGNPALGRQVGQTIGAIGGGFLPFSVDPLTAAYAQQMQQAQQA